MTDDLKIGARNSAKDAERLQSIHDFAVENGAQCGPVDSDKSLADELVAYGEAVKLLGETADGGLHFGGLLVRFGGPDNTDLSKTRDYFTKATDFGAARETDIYYNHRLPLKTKNGDAITVTKRIGRGKLEVRDEGVFLDAVTYNREEYERMLNGVLKKSLDMHGLSSGTAGHLVERERQANGSHWIKSWPLGLDASLTPIPAEPGTYVVPLKSLITTEQAGRPALDSATVESKHVSPPPVLSQGESSMNEDISVAVQAAVKAELEAREAKAKAEAEVREALKAELRKEIQSERKSGYTYHKTATKGDGDEAQVAAFKHWLKTGDMIAARRELEEDSGVDANGQPYKTALGETTGANGGFLVPTPYHTEIIAKRDEVAIPMRMGVKPLTTALASLAVPVENAKQSNFAIVAEAGTVDESEPTLSQVTITVYNWRRLIKVSNELLQDATSNLDSYLSNSIGRALGLTINAYVLTGTGTGQPQGGVVGGTLGTTAASATVLTAAEVIGHVYKMPAGYRDNMAWAMATATEGHVRGLTSNYLAFNPTPVGKGNPRGGNVAVGSDLLGYPVFNSASMAALATTNKTVLLANWEYYGFAERQQLVVERNPWLYMASGQVGIFASVRWGGAVLQAEAFQYIQQA